MNILHVTVFVVCCSGQRSYGKLCGEDCCAYYFKRDGDCEECPTGTVRLSGDDEDFCRPCPGGFHGYKCLNLCKCSKHERCESSQGCISKGGNVGSEHTTNKRSIQSTTNYMKLKG
ncbi:protein draper-like [Mytilus californianus]|uniref:protein draper-like n=1 Tax=Mytilus californianus TaxID=6549 RepID=UPI002245B116|nr:protein draper-like [Mytilus californianus]